MHMQKNSLYRDRREIGYLECLKHRQRRLVPALVGRPIPFQVQNQTCQLWPVWEIRTTQRNKDRLSQTCYNTRCAHLQRRKIFSTIANIYVVPNRSLKNLQILDETSGDCQQRSVIKFKSYPALHFKEVYARHPMHNKRV